MNLFKNNFTLADQLPKLYNKRCKIIQQLERLDHRIALAEFEKEKKDWSEKVTEDEMDHILDKIWD
jgi:hypothetical protein